MRLQDIMSKEVATTAASESADRAFERMRQRRIHHLAVTDKNEIVGIISDRDLGGPRGTRVREGHTVRDLMTSKPVMVPPDTTIRQAANRMKSRFIGCLLVGEGTRVQGIVTVSDLLELIGRGLEKPIQPQNRPTLRRKAGWGYPRSAAGARHR